MVHVDVPWNKVLTVSEIWFPSAGTTLSLPGCWRPRWVRLFHLERRIGGVIGRWTERQTLVTDLATIDDLLARMSQTMRYEIRRALGRDEMRIEEWTPARIVDFATRRDSQNANQPLLARLEALRAQGRLTIRAALVGDEPQCAHAIIHDGRIARGLHSYSARHLGDRAYAARVARATKMLYYRDLFHLREQGIEEFDWGGFTGRPGNGIDTLKLEFRGALRKAWCFDGMLLPRLSPLRF